MAECLEQHLLQEVPVPFDDVRRVRDIRQGLISRQIGKTDNAVMRMVAITHRLWTKARVNRPDNYDVILRLLGDVQVWEFRMAEEEKLNGES